MPNIAYVNGEFLPLEDAKISVEDRGVQFGDGVYEVVRVYGGQPFQLEAHLDRLTRSAQAIQIPIPLTMAEWESLTLKGIRLSQYQEAKVYLQVTRGVAPREHGFSSVLIPTLVMTVCEMNCPDESSEELGVVGITLPDIRWGRCSIKSLNLLPNVLAKQQAAQAGAFEAIFVREGYVTEGTSSNIIMVKDGTVATPALSDHLLAGVTRQTVLNLAREAGSIVEERAIFKKELYEADELFLVGTTIEVLPVIQLDGQTIGNGCSGPIAKALLARLRALVTHNSIQV